MATITYDMDLDVRDALKSLGKFNKGLKDTDKNFEKVDKDSKNLTKTFGGLAKVLTGLVGTLGFGALVKSSLDSADALGKVSNKVGLTVKSLQELRFVADQAGISSKTLDTSMQRFSRRVGEAANGTGVLKKDLAAMNIAIKNTDGSMRNIDDIFTDYTNGIRNATSAQEKLRLAVAAFDMEGANMVNMLGESSEAFKAMREEATKLAPLLSNSQVEAATKANDAWAKVKFQLQQISKVVLVELAPGMEELAKSISKILANKENIKGLQDAFIGISDSLKSIANILTSDLISTLFDLAKWGALALAVKSFAGSLRWAGKILAAYKNAVLGATKAGVALTGAQTLGAIAGKKFFSAISNGLKIVGWTALLGFLLDMKDSLVTLTGVFGSAEEGANGFFDTLHKKALDFQKSDLSVFELMANGIRGITDATSGGLITSGIDAALGKDFGRNVIDTREKTEGYVRNEDVTEESKAAGRAEIARLDALDAAKRKGFKLSVDLHSVMKQQMGEMFVAYDKEQDALKARNAELMSTVNSLLPLKSATDTYNRQINELVEALNNGIITQEQYNAAVAEAKTNLDNVNPAMIKMRKELEAIEAIQKKVKESIANTAKAYTPVIQQQRKFAKITAELKAAFKTGVLTQKQYAIATSNLNKEIKAFNRAQLGQSTAWSDGWKRAFQDYADDAADAASTAERLFKTATQGMEDAIVGFAKTGKFEWKSFVSSMLEELLRAQIRSLFSKLMGGLTSTFSSATASMSQQVQGVGAGGGASNPIGEIFGGTGSAAGGNCVKLCSGSAKEIGEAVGDSQGGFMDSITGALGGVWDGITGALGAGGDWLGDIFGSITSGAGSIWDSVTGVLGDGAGSVWDGITDIFSGDGLLGGIGDTVGGLWDSISGMFGGSSGSSGIMDSITSLFGGSSTASGGSVLDKAINGGGIGGAFGGMSDLTGLFGGGESELDKRRRESKERSASLRTQYAQTDSARQQENTSYLSNAWEGIKSVGSSISNAASGAWDTVKDIGGSLWDAGSSIVSGIGDMFSGWFADGGNIPLGSFGIVGEKGPEMISGPANITPMGGFGGGTNLTVTINAVDAPSFQQLVARDPGFIAAVAMQGAKQFQGGL